MGQIKLGCVAWALPGGGMYAPYVAKRAGLEGIQLELGSYTAGFPLAQRDVQKAYLEDKERYGLEYPAIVLNDVMDNEFIYGRNTEHGRIAYEQMELAVEVAEEMAIDQIMIPNFINNLITEKVHVEHTIQALKFICEKAAKKGILIVTENALDWREQTRLLELVGCANLKIHFDTQNFKFNFDRNQCEQLKGLLPYMVPQLHVKDGVLNPGECLLGEGNTDFFAQMQILLETGFCGWIILENYYNFIPLRNDSIRESQMQMLQKDIATLRKCFA